MGGELRTLCFAPPARVTSILKFMQDCYNSLRHLSLTDLLKLHTLPFKSACCLLDPTGKLSKHWVRKAQVWYDCGNNCQRMVYQCLPLCAFCRVAALFVLERCKGQVSRNAQAHYQHTALLRTRKHVLRRVGALQERRLGHPVKVGGLCRMGVELA